MIIILLTPKIKIGKIDRLNLNSNLKILFKKFVCCIAYMEHGQHGAIGALLVYCLVRRSVDPFLVLP